MFQTPPREGPVRSWLLMGAWAVVIFSAVPFARALLHSIDDLWGTGMLRWFSIAVIGASAALAAFYVYRSLKRLPWSRLAWLVGIVAIFVYLVLEKMKTPSEALHFIEYGLLGLLAFRALSHRLRDHLVYVCAVLICLLMMATAMACAVFPFVVR